MKNDLNYAVQLIQKADGILITAGAGMSVDSGLLDFRSVGGFWNAYPPFEALGLQFNAAANPTFYLNHPEQAYWFYAHRLNTYRQTPPHEGYQILKGWANKKKHGYFVFTSNVDGHFQKAGFADERVYEVHGTLHRLQCMENCSDLSWPAHAFQPTVDEEKYLMTSPKPRCPFCGGLARQNVLMFDDWFFCPSFFEPKEAALHQWLKQVENLVVIEIGAGKAVPTVRYFSERTAKAKKAGFIRINPLDAGVPKMHFLSLEMKGLEALKKLDELLLERE
ncbi:NAD-dependent deacetylase [Pasteurellaceae bacterium RH1A]|nr:NAD-dependent deacetylase [Pasteurellaceae bacterium RH1A]